MSDYKRPRLLDALIIFGIFALLAYYLVVSLSTNDPLWVLPTFRGEPARIVVYSGGEEKEITPASPDFEAINRELNDVLSDISTFHESLGVSESSLVDYREKYDTVEVFYPERISIHTRFGFGRPNNLLIPFSGRHSEYNPVFGGYNGVYWPGVLGLKTLDPLKDALASRGYLQD